MTSFRWYRLNPFYWLRSWRAARYYKRHPIAPITAAQFAEAVSDMDWTPPPESDGFYSSTFGKQRTVVIHKRKVGED